MQPNIYLVIGEYRQTHLTGKITSSKFNQIALRYEDAKNF